MANTKTLRDLAQSILAGVQRLEELGTEAEDFHADAERGLNEADATVWSLVEWIEDGRPA